MSSARPVAAVAALLLALAGVAAWVVRSTGGPAEELQSATVLPERSALPEFSLTDHEGRPFTRERLRGRTSLLFFGFTHCPDICPVTLQQLADARRELASGSTHAASLPGIVLISVDPERDTPAKLAAYVRHFGDDIVGVTGTRDAIRALAEPLGIFFEKQATGDDYAVSHSTAVLVVDRDAALFALFSAPHRVDSFVHDLPLLMASQ